MLIENLTYWISAWGILGALLFAVIIGRQFAELVMGISFYKKHIEEINRKLDYLQDREAREIEAISNANKTVENKYEELSAKIALEMHQLITMKMEELCNKSKSTSK